MDEKMYRLAKPEFNNSILYQIKDVLNSGNLLQGVHVSEFENALTSYLQVKNAFCVTSGTAALHIALLALEIGAGDEVIVPAFTFPATVNTVEISGARPILVDINLSDCCIDTSIIEEKITNKTKAIIVVHEFGMPANISEIKAICNKHNLLLIEDSACAIGAEYNGKKIGNFGDISCFSFHPRKILTTGEGGCLTTHNSEIAKRIQLLRNHGMEFIDNKLEFLLPGLNYRMTEIQAIMGIDQISVLDKMLSVRKEQAKIYNDQLPKYNIKLMDIFPERENVYQTYHIILDENADRSRIIKELLKYNIQSNLGAQAIHCQLYYKNKYNFKPEDYPNSLMAYNSGLALPIGSHLKEKDIYFILATIKSILNDL